MSNYPFVDFYYKDKIVKKMPEDRNEGAEVVNTCFEKVRNSKKREFDTFIALKNTLQFPDGVHIHIGCFSFSGPVINVFILQISESLLELSQLEK